jgi:hypothetical protein
LHVALGERIRHTSPANLKNLANQRITSLRVDLQDVLVACAPDGCADLGLPGLSLTEMCEPTDYRKTQDLAWAARIFAEALLVPSCTRFPEGNLIIFPDRLRPGSTIAVVDTLDPELYVDWENLP